MSTAGTEGGNSNAAPPQCSFKRFGRCEHTVLKLLKCGTRGCNNLLHHLCANEWQQCFYTDKHGSWPPPADAITGAYNNPYETDINYCATCQPNEVTPINNNNTAWTTQTLAATPPPPTTTITTTLNNGPASAVTTNKLKGEQ